MQFSDTSNLTGLIQSCERKTPLGSAGISGNTTLLKQFTARINDAGVIIWSKIFESQGAWKYDDTNQTNLPQAYTDTTTGTSKYALSAEALTINRVDFKNSEGAYIKLESITQENIDKGLDDFLSDNGVPKYYRLVGRTIEVFPAPSYDSTAGLKIYFDRAGISFTSSDTTAVPGFASPFHYLLATKASMEWLIDNNVRPNQVALYRDEWLNGLADLKLHYSSRLGDLKPKLSNKLRNINWK